MKPQEPKVPLLLAFLHQSNGVESAWQAGNIFLSSGNHLDSRSLCIVSEKDYLTGLEVTIPPSSIFFLSN